MKESIEENETGNKIDLLKLQTISSRISDASEQEKMKSIFDIIEGDDSLLKEIKDNLIEKGQKKQDQNFSKFLYISKDIMFMLILLISSGLNFSYLYFPFFLIVFLSYFCLFNTGKKIKRFKRILEIISLIYSVGLLIFKLYFSISVRKGKDFSDKKNLLLDLGILNLLNENSNYFLISSFIGECFVIVFSILSIIISCLSTKDDIGLNDKDNNNELTLDIFYSMMTKSIYLLYFSIVGWSIFNRSLLTLIYILPMNIILYILAMNHGKKILFYIFKIFSIILIIVIPVHIILINIFNIFSVRNHYVTKDIEIIDNYPKLINFWTKLGINQAFHADMKGYQLAIEFSGYLFGCLSILVLMYINKQVTFDNFRKIINPSKLEEINNDDDELYNNSCQNFIKLFKKILYYPPFILHICRVFAILWLLLYQNFYSIGIIIWLFFSFLYLRTSSNKIVTIIFLAPIVIICLFCYHLANIDGFFEDKKEDKIYKNFALGKFMHKNVEYILCNIFYFFTTLFIYSLYHYKEGKKIKKKEEEKEPNKKEQLKKGLIFQKEDKNDIINTNSNENIDNKGNEDFFEKKSKDIDELFNDEEKEVKEENIEDLYENLSIMNIIIKAAFSNIDKITLIILYFLSVDSINIIHFILVIIFMLQLLFSKFMLKYSIAFIAFSQIIFLAEYLVDLFKNDDYSNLQINIIKLFIPFDLKKTSIDYLLYLMAYCYYAQNQLYYSEFFKKIEYDENISLNIYIKVKFHNYPRVQKVLFVIGNIIKEIYIWTLIIIFIIFNGLFEISIFYAIILLLFLSIMFRFLKNIKNQKKNEIHPVLNWMLLIFCALNMFSVYAYQLIFLDIFNLKNYFNESDNFFIKNLPAFGFYRYFNNKLHLKFLPHFIINFAMKLFISEMKNLKKRYEQEKDIELNQINENFKKKKYEMLIEHKETLIKKEQSNKMLKKKKI